MFFFSESAIHFSNFQISKKLSWTWNSKFPPYQITVMGGNFKFPVQDSFSEYFLGGDLEIWKTNPTFWKKATFRMNEGSGIVLTPLCPPLLDLMASVYTMCIPNSPQDIKYTYSVCTGIDLWSHIHLNVGPGASYHLFAARTKARLVLLCPFHWIRRSLKPNY